MSLDIDPVAMQDFANKARPHSVALKQAKVSLTVPDTALGNFTEATHLVALLNQQLDDVNDRMGAAGGALANLVEAAETAAGMAGKSDADVAAAMKTVTARVEAAQRQLKPTRAT